MKNKKIRIISPITLIVVLCLDVAVVYWVILAVQKIKAEVTTAGIAFIILDIFAILLAIFLTKEVLSYGIAFRENEFEFTAIDNDNLFEYNNIASVEVQRDESASLTKNFSQRHSMLILHLKDDSVASIDLGLTTRKALINVHKEICTRCNIEYIDTISKNKFNNKQ